MQTDRCIQCGSVVSLMRARAPDQHDTCGLLGMPSPPPRTGRCRTRHVRLERGRASEGLIVQNVMKGWNGTCVFGVLEGS